MSVEVPENIRADVVHKGKVLLIFPFEAHSLVMAALSRKHLEKAGYDVEMICYPDTVHASYTFVGLWEHSGGYIS